MDIMTGIELKNKARQAKRKGIFSIEGKMHSLHNLKVPLRAFILTESEKEVVKSKMKQCHECNRWKYNLELGLSDRCKRQQECDRSK